MIRRPAVMVKTCVAAGCSNTNKDGVSLHKFHQDRTLRKKVDRSSEEAPRQVGTNYSVLCSQHFEKSCFMPSPALMLSLGVGKKKPSLKPDAVPTIFSKPLSHGSKRSCDFDSPAPKRRSAYEKREQCRVSLNY